MSRLMSLACHAPHVRVFRGFPICQAGAGNRNILPGRGYLIVRLVGQHDMRVTGVSRACHGLWVKTMKWVRHLSGPVPETGISCPEGRI